MVSITKIEGKNLSIFSMQPSCGKKIFEHLIETSFALKYFLMWYIFERILHQICWIWISLNKQFTKYLHQLNHWAICFDQNFSISNIFRKQFHPKWNHIDFRLKLVFKIVRFLINRRYIASSKWCQDISPRRHFTPGHFTPLFEKRIRVNRNIKKTTIA